MMALLETLMFFGLWNFGCELIKLMYQVQYALELLASSIHCCCIKGASELVNTTMA